MNMLIVYWSGTGNTEAMAHLIEEGAAATGAAVTVKEVSAANPADVEKADAVAFGCSAMGDEILEEDEFEPFMKSVMGKLNGKKTGLFGSYDWGDGEWMRQWAKDVRAAGATLLNDGLIVNLEPVGNDVGRCKEFGKMLAEM
ncbi:Flavodoxin [Methanosarcinaceae archaeon Ag5]|uniref:Flavodoxin n=1 Tax=Methanolapillus africanus TaxID=3028297 RepID=A0AAE4MIU5_9EURY|nr:Flavodoxin [Methanosarcinaceae archaeon Ag5]